MANLARFTGPLFDVDTFVVFDDFWMDRDDQQWTDVITDTGTASVGDTARGILVLTPSDGTVADNDEVYVGSTNELFIYAAGKPIYGRCRLQFTETTSGVYNAFFGFANAFAANLLVDDGGGMRASGSVCAIYKIDGETSWRVTTRDNDGVETNLTDVAIGGASYQVLEIWIEDFTSTAMQAKFAIDGQICRDSTTLKPITHTVTIASATEMSVGAGAKLGAATNNDVLNVDYIYAHQLR